MSYRYIGNKTRLASTIVDVISSEVNPGATVADPMCGTAAMSAELRARGYAVAASDLLTFAVQHATVRLLIDETPEFRGLGMTYQEALDELNSLSGEEGLFWREYGPCGAPVAGVPPRKYFSADNAAHVDAIRRRLNEWRGALTDTEHALLRHDLVLAANRVANIAGTYGHFRSSWSSGSLRPLHLNASTFSRPSGRPTSSHTVLQGPVESLAPEISADACYLDPPYMKQQYAANYHILETLARGDEPTPVGVSGLRDWWDQYSDFCSKRNIADAFAATFEKMDCPIFFVSYSEDGLLPPNVMSRMFADFGEVTRFEFDYQRFKSNVGGAGGQVTEYVYMIRKR